MKTKLFFLTLLAVAITSCTTVRPTYLPTPDQIDVNEFGSYIRIIGKSKLKVQGELIAVGSNTMVVLTRKTKNCVIIPLSTVKSFELRYARSKFYGGTIPVYTASTLLHGYYLFMTAPINIFVTTSVSVSASNAFKYSDKVMTIDQLKMFARFPQGIPPNVDLTLIGSANQ